MLSLNASINPLQNLHIGAVAGHAQTSASQGPQSLKDVIDTLSKALTQGGHLDQDSPLGKMVGDKLKEMNPLAAAIGGGSQDMVKAALGEVIKDKLGDNFGAASNLGLGGGAGQPDLMSQVLNGLGKASLDDLLSKQGDGTKFSSSDMPLLDKVAQFMDDNPSKFPAPDSGSWKNELKEDNYLNKDETDSFRAALDMLGTQLGQQQNGVADSGAGSPLGNNAFATDPSGGQSPTQDLGQLLSGLLQQGLNANQGNGVGSPTGNSGNSVTQDLGQLLGGLIEKGLEASQNGNGVNGNGGQQNPMFAQHDLQNSLADAASSIVTALLGGTNGNNNLS